MSIASILDLARNEARRLQQNPSVSGESSPALHAAVAQVWEMIEPQLPRSQKVDELNGLIASITGRARPEDTPGEH